jgi:hypothetical protein
MDLFCLFNVLCFDVSDAYSKGYSGLSYVGGQQMSKIDTSDRGRVKELKEGGWEVLYKGKSYKYFASKIGAKTYLEVLKSGEIDKTRTVSKVQRVLQDNSSKGGDKPRERKDSGFLYDSGL